MPHAGEWKVRPHLFEDDDGTPKAHMVLDTGITALTGQGTAHCHPSDANVPEIGDRPAAVRATENLGQQLLNIADRDIEGMGMPRPRTRQVTGRPT